MAGDHISIVPLSGGQMLIYIVAVAGSNTREQKNVNHLELECQNVCRGFSLFCRDEASVYFHAREGSCLKKKNMSSSSRD